MFTGRSPEEIEAIHNRILNLLREHPGINAKTIAVTLYKCKYNQYYSSKIYNELYKLQKLNKIERFDKCFWKIKE